ncbi:DHH family phosphoesterase [Zunongwangia profunda]|uniref:Phosphoesterase domain-containing protein n=4 Tax=Zunongwangia profunda TaxID=398743 RepID=D5BLQ6_ZUNPS|nr:bifunctional oligoribonuclease/PAP phosphatase NrnA [Zunongwangia profunda]ADF52022.1 phosphoesterase domain-containing protein [Zunongwangia profunda SM-A87]MAC65398.1 bifunctional oligoribonuclease/PAP phosphatase NrnA [Flavobacteriaceae bacterium]MAS70112.1 bifunctional oligoribonuclease/PAP phosphatase NrnA [Zunongwangia sp.]HCV80525.1 bifunctional oligoribonuclease/PAP phosphatase NrnA [Zunongwangia profunda]|tara:strand:+ start:4544 stop:5560 length:1017 start_codon:yes stop_codon:yes gene_type:complete
MIEQYILEITAELSKANNIVIVPHKGPDGDAMGSTLALMHFLKDKGHNANVIAPNEYPNFLKWLPGNDQVIIYDESKKLADDIIEKAEIIFTLDFNDLSRCGDMQQALEASEATFIMIDHHQEPANYADYTYSDTSMSSTCEMVYHFIERLRAKNKITPEIASCLYTGIMTDTGSFRFSSTTPNTHRVVADLIEKGAENSKIHQDVFDTNSESRLQLLGVALQNLKVNRQFRTAYITISQEELDAHNFKKGDTEGFVNYGLSLDGIVFAAIFIENKQEGIIKISFRSKGDFSVNTFARAHFNGGGHNNAAGGRSEMSMNDTIVEFNKLLPEYKEQLQA